MSVTNHKNKDISFAPFVYIPWCAVVKACLRSESAASQQAMITKFGPEVQHTLVKIFVVLGIDRFRPSWSNLT